jgi:DNA polymerase-3 subunit alpha (Gram-positive type)
MFPKAHAVAYVTMGLRIAYYKVHYPLAYYAAFFSIRAKAFNYELMCQGRDKLIANMKAIKAKGKDMSAKEEDVVSDGLLVQEMYSRGFEFMPIDIYRAKARRFQIIDGKLMPSFVSIDGLGDTAAIALEEAVKQGPFISKDDLKRRAGLSQTSIEKMSELGLLSGLPESNQISLTDLFKV